MADYNGGTGDDLFNGTPEPDLAHGGDGNDELYGGGGDDHLIGEGGNDTLHGGAGKDWLEGGAGDDLLVIDNGETPVAGDRFSGGDGYDVLLVTGFGDVTQAQFDPDLERLNAGTGVRIRPDQFATFASLNGTFYLSGGGTADFTGKQTSGVLVLNPVGNKTGNTVILGQDGFTSVSGSYADDVIDGSAATRNQQIFGSEGNDIIRGGSGDDVLNGGAYYDRLEGGDGNDTLSSGGIVPDPYAGASVPDVVYPFDPTKTGVEMMIGGRGDDLYQIATGTEVIVELAGEGNDTVSTYTSFALPTGAEIETLRVGYSGATNAVNLTGNEFANQVIGSNGDNVLDGRDGADLLFSWAGTDSLLGGNGDDGLYFGAWFGTGDIADGGAGTDSLALQGNYANQSLAGISNVEVLLVASGSDTRFGDLAGNSYSYSLSAADSNIAAGGTLTVSATGLRASENLVFDGSAETNGNFRFFAGQGNDDLKGGAGSDGFFFGADHNMTGADRVDGGAGIDSLALRGNYAGADALVFQNGSFANVEVLTFLSGHTNEYGGPVAANGFDYDVRTADSNVAGGALLQVIAVNLRADESLSFDGRAESDAAFRIFSGAGDDRLYGGAGDDTLYGGLGADAIDGGAGADTYVYRSILDSTAASRDTIVFGSGDRIDLSPMDAVDGAPANEAFTFIGATAFGHHAGELRAYDGGAGQWFVEGDVNGDGNADFVLAVTTAAPLAASDFIL